MKKFLFLLIVVIVLSAASCQKAPSNVMGEKSEAKAPVTEGGITGNPVVDSVGNDLNNVDVVEKDLGTEDLNEIDSGLQDIENI